MSGINPRNPVYNIMSNSWFLDGVEIDDPRKAGLRAAAMPPHLEYDNLPSPDAMKRAFESVDQRIVIDPKPVHLVAHRERTIVRIFIDFKGEVAADIRMGGLTFNQAFAINTRMDQIKLKLLALAEEGFGPPAEGNEKKMDGAG